MIHTTVGLYSNGDYKINGVAEENLENHIEYNKQMRPGRSLFVDGKCVIIGISHTVEKIKEFEDKIKSDPKFVRFQDTAPYV